MLTETQETLRVLSISNSMDKTDNLLNKLKENGYNARGTHIDNKDQLNVELDSFNHWDLIVADECLRDINIEQIITGASHRNLYIPIIFISNNKHQAPYHLLHNSMLRVIIGEDDSDYFADIAIKEIHDSNIRKNNMLMSLALNSIEMHSRNMLSQQNYALIYTINGIICEVDETFMNLCKLENKNIIINKPIETLIAREDAELFSDFIQGIESATESISVLEVSLEINEIQTPVTIIARPTSFNGKFSLCLQLKKIAKRNKSIPISAPVSKAKHNNTITDYSNFQQQFNLALKKALSENIPSLLCCINLGCLFKEIKNSDQVDSKDIFNDIALNIQEVASNNLVICNLQNGYFLLLANNVNRSDGKQLINNIINKLDNKEIIIDNNKTIIVSAFAGMTMINSDSDNSQDLISKVKQESVVSYINKIKSPDVYMHNDALDESSYDKKLLNIIKDNIKNNKLDLRYQGILNTKENSFAIYDCFGLIKTDTGVVRDSDLILKFSNSEIWNKLDKLKIVTSINEIKSKVAKITSVIISIGMNSLKNNEFLEWLDDFIMGKKVDSSYFIVETHEYFASKYLEDTKKIFSKLKDKGYKSCISNFGCSINYKKLINSLEPNFIRLDNTFTDKLDDDNIKDIKKIASAVKNTHTKIIVSNINGINIMQKILQTNMFLLAGNYIQEANKNIEDQL